MYPRPLLRLEHLAVLIKHNVFCSLVQIFLIMITCIGVKIFEFSLSFGGNNAKRSAWYNEANFALRTNCLEVLVKQSTVSKFSYLSFDMGNYRPFAFILPG